VRGRLEGVRGRLEGMRGRLEGVRGVWVSSINGNRCFT